MLCGKKQCKQNFIWTTIKTRFRKIVFSVKMGSYLLELILTLMRKAIRNQALFSYHHWLSRYPRWKGLIVLCPALCGESHIYDY